MANPTFKASGKYLKNSSLSGPKFNMKEVDTSFHDDIKKNELKFLPYSNEEINDDVEAREKPNSIEDGNTISYNIQPGRRGRGMFYQLSQLSDPNDINNYKKVHPEVVCKPVKPEKEGFTEEKQEFKYLPFTEDSKDNSISGLEEPGNIQPGRRGRGRIYELSQDSNKDLLTQVEKFSDESSENNQELKYLPYSKDSNDGKVIGNEEPDNIQPGRRCRGRMFELSELSNNKSDSKDDLLTQVEGFTNTDDKSLIMIAIVLLIILIMIRCITRK
jgi:hypothetical protein